MRQTTIQPLRGSDWGRWEESRGVGVMLEEMVERELSLAVEAGEDRNLAKSLTVDVDQGED